MKLTPKSLVVLLSSCLLLCASAAAQERHMQLLAPDVGWALGGDRLYWTMDNGVHWADITPTAAPLAGSRTVSGARISDVYFLNTSEAWVLLSTWDSPTQNWRLDIARTSDSGASWSVTPLTYPDLIPTLQDALAGPAGMCFVDSSHGWIDIGFSGNSRPGKLLVTEDGGETWSWRGGPVVAGAIRFVSAKDGWLAGGPDSNLYVTRNGGQTWQQVTLTPPQEVGAATDATYFLPVFESVLRGFLAVNYSGSEGTPPRLGLYATEDGGRTWFLHELLVEAGKATVGTMIPFDIADSMAFVPMRRNSQGIGLGKVPLGGRHSSKVTVSSAGVLQLSFADAVHGWLLRRDGRLLSTTDGGVTWTDSAPWSRVGAGGPAQIVPSMSGTAEPRPPLFPSLPEANAGGGGGSGSHTSAHLGFDITRVIGVSDMKTWWNYSPYYDTSVYLPGSANRGVDKNLIPSWITGVVGEGWGLIPIWFGLQAPCTQCPICPSMFSSDPTTANSQGQTEAGNAETAAKNLALSTTVIYKDIENYDTTNATCSKAVQKFVSGWVSKLKNDGYSAGVYGNNIPAQQDFSQASPQPDEVWVTKSDNRATIWKLGSLDDSLWKNHQRLHQYWIGSNPNVGFSQSFGGTQYYSIDQDIEDAPATGGQGSKNASRWNWAFQTLNNTGSYPGSSTQPWTTAFGVNDAGGDLTSCQVLGAVVCDLIGGGSAQVVGWENTNVYQNTFSPISCTGWTQIQVYGVNNLGHLVGSVSNGQSGPYEGFFYTPSSGCSVFTFNDSGTLTVAFGINDADQIVGEYTDSNGGYHGFFYDTNQEPFPTTAFDYPGAPAGTTTLEGINGQGQIVGDYYSGSTCQPFIWNHASDLSYPLIPTTGPSCSSQLGINGNGWAVGQAKTKTGNFLYSDGQVSPFPLDPNNGSGCTACDFAYGIDNYGRVVGQYGIGPSPSFPTGALYGFWAVGGP